MPVEAPNNTELLSDFAPEPGVAKMLGVTLRTLRRWHASRTGPPRTVIGRRIFYRRSSLLSWMVSHEEPRSRKAARR